MNQSNHSVTDRDDWNTNWSAQSRIAEVNPAQNYRHRLVVNKLQDEAIGSCLDVGCGQGDLLLEVARRLPKVKLYGIEGSSTGARITKSKVSESSVWSFDLQNDFASWPVEVRDLKVDAVVLSEVVEHLDAPSLVLRNVKKCLKPEGMLIVTVPAGPMTAFDRSIGHRTHYTSSTLRELLESSGFKVDTVWSAGFPFFNLYKLTVLIRGKKLSEDIGKFNSDKARLATTVMRLFGFLFRLNLRNSPLGRQLVAIAQQAS